MPSAIYIHIPYCVSKCPYCDFSSVPIDTSINSYVEALSTEIRKRLFNRSHVNTIYVGGGTPTILEPNQITQLFHCLNQSFQISNDAEITVEANPGSLSAAKAHALAVAGVNRISLGAQSFSDSELQSLGRRHQVRDIYASVSILRKAGIQNLNLDLIFGIPGQTSESWDHSLSEAVSLAPQHISTYCLTFEKETPCQRLLDMGKIQKKTDDEELELYEFAHETLVAEGYEHYEISNFALPGRRSAHNIIYWHNHEYIGFGASAVSYLDGRRISNIRQPVEYIRAMETVGNSAAQVEEIPSDVQAIETLLQRLRLDTWINCEAFRTRFNVNPSALFGDAFDNLVEAGLIEFSGDSIRSTFKGWELANEVALKFIP